MSGGAEIERMIELLARLPGLGPRSARRAALHMVKRRERLLEPLAAAMTEVAATVRTCRHCDNLTTTETCEICHGAGRSADVLTVHGLQ